MWCIWAFAISPIWKETITGYKRCRRQFSKDWKFCSFGTCELLEYEREDKRGTTKNLKVLNIRRFISRDQLALRELEERQSVYSTVMKVDKYATRLRKPTSFHRPNVRLYGSRPSSRSRHEAPLGRSMKGYEHLESVNHQRQLRLVHAGFFSTFCRFAQSFPDKLNKHY